MNMTVRMLSLSVVWLASIAVGLGQTPPPSASKPADQTKPGFPNASRTLVDIRAELKAAKSEAGTSEHGPDLSSMPGPGMMGYGGDMGSGGGMMGSSPSEKQLLAQLIQQLRARLGSQKFKRETTEKQLRVALQQYFDADIQERVREFDNVKARVDEMEKKLQRRLDSENEIVDLQLKQMLHKADGLDFNIPGGSSGYGDMGSGSMGMMGSGMGMDTGAVAMGMAGGYGSGYGGGEDSGGYGMEGYGGAAGYIEEPLGYDTAYGITRFQRIDSTELDDSDPLKSYPEMERKRSTEKKMLNSQMLTN